VSVINIETRFRCGTHPPLTERERRVLTELALGSSTEEAAAAIQLSPHTVRSHVKSALRKLGAQTRSHAVAIAIAQGEIDVATALLSA
jgi:two-component system, NarL family, response regulator DesR